MATGGVSTPDSGKPGDRNELSDGQLQALAGKLCHEVLNREKNTRVVKGKSVR